MRINSLTVCILLLCGIMTSCLNDTLSPEIPGEGDEDPEYVRVTVTVPGAETVSTKVMSPLEECEIETIDVLVFNSRTVGPYTQHEFLYHEPGVEIVEVDGQPTQRKFSMKIRQTTTPGHVYLMVLANVSETIEKLMDQGTISEGVQREAVINQLLFELPYDQTTANEGGKWLVKPGRYTRFPMWGLSGEVTLGDPLLVVQPVSLLRACAKIDIGLNFDAGGEAQGLDNFFLEEFHLYNAYSSLMIAPTMANYDETAKKVTGLTLPTGVTTFNPNEAISYYRRAYRGDAGYNDFLNEIYLAEHPEGSQADRLNNVAVVIGGRFDSKTDDITYYRIDLVQHDNGQNTTRWLPVLRNHRYRINITKVHNRGYDTKEEAFEAMGLNTNLEIDIVDTDENVTKNVYDGQYRLGVDKTEFTIGKHGIQYVSSPKKVYVSTNHEAGWKASANVDWIKFVQDDDQTTASTYAYSSAGSGYNLKFLAEENTTTDNREGKITIQAGRLFMDIVVTQTTVSDIEISGLLSLYPMDGSNCSFQVKSTFDWSARVVDDEYNVISSFDKSGTGQTTVTYKFSGINEAMMNALHIDAKIQTITFEFYSPSGEFDSYRQAVRIGNYEFANAMNGMNIVVYPYDQPTGSGSQWYIYANTTSNSITTEALPGAAGQSATPHANSCAALGDGLWHLPTQAQANVLKNYITTSNYTQYGMSNAIYWLATSTSATTAYAWRMSNGNTMASSKATTSYRARCVRVR